MRFAPFDFKFKTDGAQKRRQLILRAQTRLMCSSAARR